MRTFTFRLQHIPHFVGLDKNICPLSVGSCIIAVTVNAAALVEKSPPPPLHRHEEGLRVQVEGGDPRGPAAASRGGPGRPAGHRQAGTCQGTGLPYLAINQLIGTTSVVVTLNFELELKKWQPWFRIRTKMAVRKSKGKGRRRKIQQVFYEFKSCSVICLTAVHICLGDITRKGTSAPLFTHCAIV